jgi:hypothetical protein
MYNKIDKGAIVLRIQFSIDGKREDQKRFKN